MHALPNTLMLDAISLYVGDSGFGSGDKYPVSSKSIKRLLDFGSETVRD
jgi:hypothetical protein